MTDRPCISGKIGWYGAWFLTSVSTRMSNYVCVQPHMYNQTCIPTHDAPTHGKGKGKQETRQIGLWTHFSPAHKDSPPWSTGWVVCNPGWPISSAASISLPLVGYFQSYSLSEGENKTKLTEHFAPHLWNFSIKISKRQRVTLILLVLFNIKGLCCVELGVCFESVQWKRSKRTDALCDYVRDFLPSYSLVNYSNWNYWASTSFR